MARHHWGDDRTLIVQVRHGDEFWTDGNNAGGWTTFDIQTRKTDKLFFPDPAPAVVAARADRQAARLRLLGPFRAQCLRRRSQRRARAVPGPAQVLGEPLRHPPRPLRAPRGRAGRDLRRPRGPPRQRTRHPRPPARRVHHIQGPGAASLPAPGRGRVQGRDDPDTWTTSMWTSWRTARARTPSTSSRTPPATPWASAFWTSPTVRSRRYSAPPARTSSKPTSTPNARSTRCATTITSRSSTYPDPKHPATGAAPFRERRLQEHGGGDRQHRPRGTAGDHQRRRRRRTGHVLSGRTRRQAVHGPVPPRSGRQCGESRCPPSRGVPGPGTAAVSPATSRCPRTMSKASASASSCCRAASCSRCPPPGATTASRRCSRAWGWACWK